MCVFFSFVSIDLGINLRIDFCFPHMMKRVKPYCIKLKFVTVVWLDQRVLDSRILELYVQFQRLIVRAIGSKRSSSVSL